VRCAYPGYDPGYDSATRSPGKATGRTRGSHGGGTTTALKQRGALPLPVSRPLDYTAAMDFEWDETKSEACFQSRGFDFAFAARAFFDPDRLVEADTRQSYGEARFQLMGNIEGRLFVVVFTPRNDVICLISARKANLREVRHYEASTREN